MKTRKFNETENKKSTGKKKSTKPKDGSLKEKKKKSIKCISLSPS